ncbi:hypothetical protein DB30_00066 [Enhygromyxa salina]|uniref:Uncharacterized protein n=1 Tax=Enhygromyxa salina TaxID=215803 RepID=A0A0C2DIP8_9BACT|nr:hypothetical protein DB30_00066 [Enhygromyxa salina]
MTDEDSLTFPFRGSRFRIVVAIVAPLIVVAVAQLNLPLWAAGLLAAGLILVVFGTLQAVLRARYRR